VDLVKYGAAQKQYNISHAVEFWYPVPPYEEQIEIRKELDEKSGLIADSISNVQEIIGLMKEYRTTLISEVVTGKIDVRDEAIP
jgi:type I restriction enzyme S subunit